jgi:hypothetical protein
LKRRTSQKRPPGPAWDVGGDRSDDRRLIHASGLLDPIAKRHWLRVLPWLTPADRLRLRQILSADSTLPPS